MNPPILVIAGGMATRLGALSVKTPKSLVEVAGEPFIVHQFRRFVSQGIRDVILCVGHLAETLESFVGDGSRFGVRVRYSFDGPVPLGTGGAVRKALSYVDHFFYVTYGDSYLEVDYRDVCARYLKSGLDAMMTVHRREGVREPGNARLENGRVVEYRKKNLTADLTHVDYGLLVMNKHVFSDPPVSGPEDLSQVLTSLSRKERLAGYEVEKKFYEIGTPEGIAELSDYLIKTPMMAREARGN